jgi:septal ring-binding cell division protein DamX
MEPAFSRLQPNSIRAVTIAALWLSSGAASAMAAGPMPVEGLRIWGEVEQIQDGKTLPLVARQSLRQDDVIRTESDARVELGLPSDARVTLGSDTRMLLHSAELIAGRGDYVLRAKLLSGLARAEARKPADGPTPDLRLTVGRLRLRVHGADAWLRSDEGGDMVCVIEGVVEAQLPQGPARIDRFGDCLHLAPGARALTLETLPAKAMEVRLAMTSVPGAIANLPSVPVQPVALVEMSSSSREPPDFFDPNLVVARNEVNVGVQRVANAEDMSAEMAEAMAMEKAASPAAIGVKPPAMLAPSPASAVPAQSDTGANPSAGTVTGPQSGTAAVDVHNGWTLVVASSDLRRSADIMARDLRGRGLAAEVFEAKVKDRLVYRVGVGRHPSMNAAMEAVPQIRQQAPQLQPWPARF